MKLPHPQIDDGIVQPCAIAVVKRRYHLNGGRGGQRGARKSADDLTLPAQEQLKCVIHKRKLDGCLALARRIAGKASVSDAVQFALKYKPENWRKTFVLMLRRAYREQMLIE
jgi:hypothetical protein